YNFIKGQETLKEKQSLLVEIQGRLKSIDEEINQLNASLSNNKDSEKTIQNLLNEKRSNLAVEKERNRLKVQDKKRLTEDLNENENTLTKILDQIELVNSDEYSGTSQFDEVEKHIEQSTNTKLEIETKMSEQQDMYRAIQEEIQKLEEDIETLRQSISGIETGLEDMVSKHSKKIKKNKKKLKQNITRKETGLQDIVSKHSKIDIVIEHQLTHLSDTYQLTFEKAESMYEMPEDISEARKTVKLTKMSIEELGHV